MLEDGDKFYCETCQADAYVKRSIEMDDDWHKKECLVCCFCGADATQAGSKKDSGVGGLLDFLGTEAEKKKAVLDESGGRPFCRDCEHYFSNPFQSRCMLHNRDVGSMDDCEDFSPASKS